MYSNEDLQSAVDAGVLSAQSAAAFKAHVARQRQLPAADEEYFRLVSGFNDIFVVIASALLLTAVVWIGSAFAPGLGWWLAAASCWALSEFFVRRRRMALPAIVLLLVFVSGLFLGTSKLLAQQSFAPMAGAAVAALGAWLHWRRFRVPITVAAGTAAAAGVLGAALFGYLPAQTALRWLLPLLFIAGLAVFALAVRWDASDTRRETRRSDVAFWLHLLAAPLMVHPIFKIVGILDGESSVARAAAVVLMYLAIGLVSLAIDRRALMVSALGYVLYAFSSLMEKTSSVQLGFAVTALVIGSSLLLLSAFWQQVRGAAIGRLPEALRARLPPLR